MATSSLKTFLYGIILGILISSSWFQIPAFSFTSRVGLDDDDPIKSDNSNNNNDCESGSTSSGRSSSSSSSSRRVVAESAELWCVAKNNAEDSALQSGLDWVCGPGGADCGPIQQAGPCYEPTDIQSHASYAFNDYFHKNLLDPRACDFGSAAALTSINPSHGKCVFPSSVLVRNGSFGGSASMVTGIGPSAADLNGGYSKFRLGWSIFAALMMFSAAFNL